ncbi:MAG: 4Fe-4S cluster-binding domain-containing protein [bacterium]|nr:MAG: 4Fe-4S cluster-binding domain-containing protein [bacterium]
MAAETYHASYLRIKDDQFMRKIKQGRSLLKNCEVCPRNCHVNRLDGELGECRSGYEPIVSSFFLHFGEEAPLVGTHGSGTIFIGGCNLQCVFCQNYETSHLLEGQPVSIAQLVKMMLTLQENSCHNINIVTPSHIVPQLVEALYQAKQQGLSVPLVYNTGGYDSMKSLQLLDGLVDIYMPDFKFYSDTLASRYTAVQDYGTVAREAIREMHRQVGDLIIEQGLAKKGLLVRHLVMPGMVNDSEKIFQFLATHISPNTYVNVMPQFRPAGETGYYPEIGRSLHYTEFLEAIRRAQEIGLRRLDKMS